MGTKARKLPAYKVFLAQLEEVALAIPLIIARGTGKKPAHRIPEAMFANMRGTLRFEAWIRKNQVAYNRLEAAQATTATAATTTTSTTKTKTAGGGSRGPA